MTAPWETSHKMDGHCHQGPTTSGPVFGRSCAYRSGSTQVQRPGEPDWLYVRHRHWGWPEKLMMMMMSVTFQRKMWSPKKMFTMFTLLQKSRLVSVTNFSPSGFPLHNSNRRNCRLLLNSASYSLKVTWPSLITLNASLSCFSSVTVLLSLLAIDRRPCPCIQPAPRRIVLYTYNISSTHSKGPYQPFYPGIRNLLSTQQTAFGWEFTLQSDLFVSKYSTLL